MTVLRPSLPPYRVTRIRVPLPALSAVGGDWRLAVRLHGRWARARPAALPTTAAPPPATNRRRVTWGLVMAGSSPVSSGRTRGRTGRGRRGRRGRRRHG